MKLADLLLLTLITVIIVYTTVILLYNKNMKDACEAKQGVYIESYCLKMERVK